MIAAVALALAAIITPAPRATEPAPCTGAYVLVTGDAPIGCDVHPPQRLDVAGIDRTTCEQMGGTYDVPGQCAEVDY